MQHIQSMEINAHSSEEILPGFTPEHPDIAVCAELSRYPDPFTPWHWHRPVELFYMESGTLEYQTPGGRCVFPKGSGGLVNSNVLHCTHFSNSGEPVVQLLHIFDPVFLSGQTGSRIEQRYILPMTTDPGIEIIPLYPEDPAQADILARIRQIFAMDPAQWGYELLLREALSAVWLSLLQQAQSSANASRSTGGDWKIRKMMIYVHEHYDEPLSIDTLAQTIPISRRACFRLFQDTLHMTPLEYIRGYRLQKACQLLAQTRQSITSIAYSCGLGSSSYFGKVFRQVYGCTPQQYRQKWHDRDSSMQKIRSNSPPPVVP